MPTTVPRRPTWAILFVVALVASLPAPRAAAAAGTIVPPDAPLTLGPDEGHVVLVFDLLNDLRSVRFFGPGDWLAKFTLPALPSGISAVLLRLPVGTYCFETFKVGKVQYRRKDRSDDGFCFKSVAGELNYPGHFVVRDAGRGGGEGRVDFEFKPKEFLSRIQLERPDLLQGRVRIIATSSVGKQWFNAVPGEFALAAYDIGETALGDRLMGDALESGSSSLLIEYGMRLAQGEGMPQDIERAVGYFEKAAALGASRGNMLACFTRAEAALRDMDQDQLALLAPKALPTCAAAAQAGDPRSQVVYAEFLRQGWGLPAPDPVQAYRWSRAAAEQGRADGQYHTGRALRDGDGVARDPKEAAVWLERAADQNHLDALVAYGRMLEDGGVVAADPARALRLYETAAAANHPGAMVAMAQRHASGRGVPKDPARADALFAAAARRDPEAMLAWAWHLATQPDPARRNGSQARRLAQQALYQRGSGHPEDHAIVAATLADAGDFMGARRDIKRAIDGVSKKAPDDPRLPAWRRQQAAYAKGEAWREP